MDLLAQMATFVDIVEGGSLSKAARRQRLSLAAVSRQLQALEKDLGEPLVLRTTRSMTVTEAGRQFYEHSVRALREVESARASVRGAGGALRVSAPVTFGLERVVPALPALLAAHPTLSLELRLEDHAADLIADGVDVAIRGGALPPDSVSLIARELVRFPKWVVAAPSYLKKHGTPKTPDALANHAALIQLAHLGDLDVWSLGDGEREIAVRVRGQLRCTALAALRELAIAGAGVALVPDWLVAGELADDRLRRVLPEWAAPPTTLWALYRVELRDAVRVRVLVDHLAHALAS
jgi:DNA-binding transcriptional LysR family regulator